MASLENIKQGMNRLRVNILDVRETSWGGDGDFVSNADIIIHAEILMDPER